MIFTSSPLTADDIATFRNAVGILCYSVGMDYVDAAAAAAHGIPIWNCPTSNNEEVSDHAVLLILAAQRRLLPLAMAAREGEWEIYQWPLLGEIHRLATRTVGTTTNSAATGTAIVLDNDGAPEMTISDVTVNEAAGTANFTGAFVGMACQDMAGTGMPSDFDYFEYQERDYRPNPALISSSPE